MDKINYLALAVAIEYEVDTDYLLNNLEKIDKRRTVNKREKLYNDGFNDSQIALIEDKSPNSITSWRYNKGLPKKIGILNEKMLECYSKGYSDKDMAEKFGLEVEYVRRWRDKRGFKSNKHGNYKKHQDKLELWQQGYNDEEIAEKLGMTKQAIYSWRKRNGVK